MLASQQLDLKRKQHLADFFATQPPQMRDAFVLGQIYFSACQTADQMRNGITPTRIDRSELRQLLAIERRLNLKLSSIQL